jgi:glycosyltransferase involved in cell wall biosynthesis
MRLAYVTRVLVNTKHAQSIQINQMVQEFINVLGKEKFIFYNNADFLNKYRRMGNFLFNLRVVKLVLSLCYYFGCVRREAKHVDSIVFTRDIAAVFICKIFGVSCAYEAHHLFESNMSSLVFRFVKNYDKLKIVYISEGVKKDFENKYSCCCNSLIAHDGYNPINSVIPAKTLSKFQDIKRGFDKIVIHCGKLDYSKGVDIFFELAAFFPEVAFVQVGSFRTKKDKDLFVSKWEKHNIFVFDDVPNKNILGILNKADVLFFPMSPRNKYWKHTSPLKLFEYFGSGVPIVGSFIGSVLEITKNFDLIEFNPDDVDDAKEKLTDCFLNIRVNKSNAKTIRSHAELQYTWLKRVENIIHWMDTGSPLKLKKNKL